MARSCLGCGADISLRDLRAKFCASCSESRGRESKRRYAARISAERVIPPRSCLDCPADISRLNHRALRCPVCVKIWGKIQARKRHIKDRMHESGRKHWHRPGRIKNCIICKQDKGLEEFYTYEYTTRQGNRSLRYDSRCKSCECERRRQWVADNPEQSSAQSKVWREKNLERCAENAKEYRSTEHGRQLRAHHQRMRCARKRVGEKGAEISPDVKKIYAEAQELQELFGVKLHVDHKRPICKGGKHEASNLQILVARDNLKKGSRY